MALIASVVQALVSETSALAAFVEHILEQNRRRRKVLKIVKVTREEVERQIEFKRKYVLAQVHTDELFGYLLRSVYFSDDNPWAGMLLRTAPPK